MKIAIIGLGQLGGALALSAKSRLKNITINGFDTQLEHAKTLHQQGAIHHIAPCVEAAVDGVDIVFLACPLREYAGIIAQIAPALSAHTIISDVGSVQQSLHLAASAYPDLHIIPAHPIAGSENSGSAHARDDLFNERLVLLTPDDPESDQAKIIADFWRSLGARDVLMLPHQLHDGIYAHVSHLPHIMAFCYAQSLQFFGAQLLPEDSLLKQALRIARSSPRIWADITIENGHALLPAIANIRVILLHMSKELLSGKSETEPKSTGNMAQLTKDFLPQLSASALIAGMAMFEAKKQINLKAFGGDSLRDIMGAAQQDPETLLEKVSEDAPKIAEILDYYASQLGDFEQAIAEENHAGILTLFTKMQQALAILSKAQTTKKPA
jgi:prephenate dehydrogenase